MLGPELRRKVMGKRWKEHVRSKIIMDAYALPPCYSLLRTSTKEVLLWYAYEVVIVLVEKIVTIYVEKMRRRYNNYVLTGIG